MYSTICFLLSWWQINIKQSYLYKIKIRFSALMHFFKLLKLSYSVTFQQFIVVIIMQACCHLCMFHKQCSENKAIWQFVMHKFVAVWQQSKNNDGIWCPGARLICFAKRNIFNCNSCSIQILGDRSVTSIICKTLLKSIKHQRNKLQVSRSNDQPSKLSNVMVSKWKKTKETLTSTNPMGYSHPIRT